MNIGQKQSNMEIKNIEELAKINNIKIPDYQRPYKWSIKNVVQLINDIIENAQKEPKRKYRLGTLVVHKDENDNINIVDGQQRILTLSLILHVINEDNDSKNSGNDIQFGFFEQIEFSNPASKMNICKNYKRIKREKERLLKNKDYFLKHCEMAVVVLDDIEEAFQFFDSQNARGKELYPHDLLKAFHLRSMETEYQDGDLLEKDKIKVVTEWEELINKDVKDYFNNVTKEDNTLAVLFERYLYRTRRWIENENALSFEKEDIDFFKGIDISTDKLPFALFIRYAHLYYEDIKKTPDENFVSDDSFPFQLNQPIINGKRFFEMVIHYFELKIKINNILKRNNGDRLFDLLEAYKGSTKAHGNSYIRNMLECALMFVVDKFGDIIQQDLDEIIKLLFIWAYHLRLCFEVVQQETVNNYAKNTHEKFMKFKPVNMFKLIHQAKNISDILSIDVPNISSCIEECQNAKEKIEKHKYKELVKYFNEYYNSE